MPEADLVLEGGGVKGLGTAGAVMALLDAGYSFPRVAGTSVGALVAAFAAAGADSAGMRDVLGRLDLRKIPDRRVPLPLVSESFSLTVRRGAYAGVKTLDVSHRCVLRATIGEGTRASLA